MEIAEITKRVKTVLQKLDFNVDDVTMDFIETYQIDSITFIEMILEIEEEFSILVPDESLIMENVNTVEKIAALVEKVLDDEGEQ